MTDTLDRTADRWTTPTPTTGEQMLDYTRRIHWWVRLFGVLALAWLIGGFLLGVYLGVKAGAEHSNASTTVTTSTNHGSYGGCISQGYDVATCTRIYG